MEDEAIVRDVGGRVAFDNEDAREGVRLAYLPDAAAQRAAHASLAAFFDEGGPTGGWSAAALAERVWQLHQAEELPCLAACLGELATFDALYVDAHQFDLFAYWRAVEKRAPPTRARRTWRRSRPAPSQRASSCASCYELAVFLLQAVKLDACEAVLSAAADHCRRTSQPVHLATAELELSTLLHRTGRTAAALALAQDSLGALERQNGAHDPGVARALVRVGELLTAVARFDEARAPQRALAIVGAREAAAARGGGGGGDDDESAVLTAEVLYAVGALHIVQAGGDLRKLEAAEALIERCMTIREATLGMRHPEYATAANRLGSLYVELDRFADAEECFGWALKVREERLGATHSRTLQTVKHMLHAAELQEKWGEALAMCKRGLEILRGHPPPAAASAGRGAAHAAAIAAMLLRTASVQRQAGEGAAAAASLREALGLLPAGGRQADDARAELAEVEAAAATGGGGGGGGARAAARRVGGDGDGGGPDLLLSRRDEHHRVGAAGGGRRRKRGRQGHPWRARPARRRRRGGGGRGARARVQARIALDRRAAEVEKLSAAEQRELLDEVAELKAKGDVLMELGGADAASDDDEAAEAAARQHLRRKVAGKCSKDRSDARAAAMKMRGAAFWDVQKQEKANVAAGMTTRRRRRGRRRRRRPRGGGRVGGGGGEEGGGGAARRDRRRRRRR